MVEPSSTRLDSVDLCGVQQANIFCSSPFFLRHALMILSWLKSHKIPVRLWSKVGGPVEFVLRTLALPGTELRTWPSPPFSVKLSRPWSLLRLRRYYDKFHATHLSTHKSTISFYEGDYPEPCLHALVSRLSRQQRVYRYAYFGHDTLPASNIPSLVCLRESLLARAYGYPITFFSRQGQPDSKYLPFFKSSRRQIQKVAVELSEEKIAPYRIPLALNLKRPVLLLLESKYEEESYRDYALAINRLLNLLEAEGWQVFTKGHPRLGNSETVINRRVASLESRIPLELLDLSQVEAVVGFCSSGMFSTSAAGIPTYCVEKLFQRHDPECRAAAIAYLTTDPGWPVRPPPIRVLNAWEDIKEIHPVKTQRSP